MGASASSEAPSRSGDGPYYGGDFEVPTGSVSSAAESLPFDSGILSPGEALAHGDHSVSLSSGLSAVGGALNNRYAGDYFESPSGSSGGGRGGMDGTRAI